MPPFRYFGNIRGRMGARFGLGTGRGKSKIALAPTKAGWLMRMGACFARLGFDWPVPPWPTCPFARVLTSEMFV